MKKSIISKVIFMILIIVLIVLILIAIVNKQTDMTKAMYKKICEESRYTFSMTEKQKKESDAKYSFKITKMDNNIDIDVSEGNQRTSTLVKDGSAYYILHNNKEYYEYDSDDIEVDILKSSLESIIQNDYEKGHEKIENKEYYYEEYEGVTDFFLMSTHNEFEENKIKTRFYYDKKNIAYIKTILNESEEELLKIEFTNNIDESVFTIPKDYAEL